MEAVLWAEGEVSVGYDAVKRRSIRRKFRNRPQRSIFGKKVRGVRFCGGGGVGEFALRLKKEFQAFN